MGTASRADRHRVGSARQRGNENGAVLIKPPDDSADWEDVLVRRRIVRKSRATSHTSAVTRTLGRPRVRDWTTATRVPSWFRT